MGRGGGGGGCRPSLIGFGGGGFFGGFGGGSFGVIVFLFTFHPLTSFSVSFLDEEEAVVVVVGLSSLLVFWALEVLGVLALVFV